MENQKILITGSEGFIGSHLVEEALNQGYKIRAFVWYNSFNSWGWLDTFPKEKLDKIEKLYIECSTIFTCNKA